MGTIYDLKRRAKELAAAIETNAVDPAKVGNLIDDTLELIDEYDKNVVGLGIRKTYATVEAMEADKVAPGGDDGKMLRFGQLVSIYDAGNADAVDNGKVFAFQKPGWKLASRVDAGYATRSEIAELPYRFLPDRSYGGYASIDYNHLANIASGEYVESLDYDCAWVQIFSASGTLEISGCVVRIMAWFSSLQPTAESYIGASSSSFEIPDGAKLCIVDLEKKNNPDGYMSMRVRQIASGADRSELNAVADTVKSIEVALSKASLFNNLGVIAGLSSLDDIIEEGYYTYSKNLAENEVINGILIVSRLSFSFIQLRYELGRTYQREYDIAARAWKEWEELQETFFKSELGDGTDCGLTQKYLSEILGSEANSESEDGSIWGELKSVSDDGFSTSQDVSALQTDNERHATARFDRIITDASIVVDGITNAESGKVVFVASKRRFAYLLDNRYYSGWPGANEYMNKSKVLPDKVYLCGAKTYVYHEGALLSTDDEALGMATAADANANSALKKIEEISTVGDVTIDQLDELNNPKSAISSYTVYFQDCPVGVLRLISNARSNIITQLLEANWDIDVSGNLLPDYNVTEPRSLVRTYNLSSEDIANEIPQGTWGRWKYNQKVITLSGGVIIE